MEKYSYSFPVFVGTFEIGRVWINRLCFIEILLCVGFVVHFDCQPPVRFLCKVYTRRAMRVFFQCFKGIAGSRGVATKLDVFVRTPHALLESCWIGLVRCFPWSQDGILEQL